MAKWHVEETPSWPFGIKIVSDTGEHIASFERMAYSTGCKTLEDLRALKGWSGKDRDETIAANEKQLAKVRMMAAAPELVEHLRDAIIDQEAEWISTINAHGSEAMALKARPSLRKRIDDGKALVRRIECGEP